MIAATARSAVCHPVQVCNGSGYRFSSESEGSYSLSGKLFSARLLNSHRCLLESGRCEVAHGFGTGYLRANGSGVISSILSSSSLQQLSSERVQIAEQLHTYFSFVQPVVGFTMMIGTKCCDVFLSVRSLFLQRNNVMGFKINLPVWHFESRLPAQLAFSIGSHENAGSNGCTANKRLAGNFSACRVPFRFLLD